MPRLSDSGSTPLSSHHRDTLASVEASAGPVTIKLSSSSSTTSMSAPRAAASDSGAPAGNGLVTTSRIVDTAPPRVTWVWPPDGATELPVTSRVGLTFNEFVDVKSAWAGSVRLYETGTEPALTRVDGDISTQEVIVNFSPRTPLKPGTQYTLEVPAGGIADYNGNAIAEPFTMTFKTAGG